MHEGPEHSKMVIHREDPVECRAGWLRLPTAPWANRRRHHHSASRSVCSILRLVEGLHGRRHHLFGVIVAGVDDIAARHLGIAASNGLLLGRGGFCFVQRCRRFTIKPSCILWGPNITSLRVTSIVALDAGVHERCVQRSKLLVTLLKLLVWLTQLLVR